MIEQQQAPGVALLFDKFTVFTSGGRPFQKIKQVAFFNVLFRCRSLNYEVIWVGKR